MTRYFMTHHMNMIASYKRHGRHLHAASAVVARHTVECLECAISGRVVNFRAVRPAQVRADTLSHTIVHAAHTVVVTHHVVTRGD